MSSLKYCFSFLPTCARGATAGSGQEEKENTERISDCAFDFEDRTLKAHLDPFLMLLAAMCSNWKLGDKTK